MTTGFDPVTMTFARNSTNSYITSKGLEQYVINLETTKDLKCIRDESALLEYNLEESIIPISE